MDDSVYFELKEIANELGLDFFPTYFETVPFEIMTEIASYGLPTRARHWSYGKVYNHQRIYGKMGLSKIYEIVLNNNPCYAFLLESNPDIANKLVIAHVYGHCDFFKNNIYFKDTNRDMVNEAVQHAIRIDEYIETYGLEKVERIMDIGFALDRHIDPHMGLYRKKYPERKVVEKTVKSGEYADLFGDEKLSKEKVVINQKLPPRPEKDLLWFLSNYAPLDEWERDVLDIIREESYYFFPQFETKIINEGWASYWHMEIMYKYDKLTPEEVIEFSRMNSGVVNPGSPFSINPYYLGYKILVDIKRRWDKKFKDGKSEIDGTEKLFEVRAMENDISFIRNYLTKELATELNLFTHGKNCSCPPNAKNKCIKCKDIIIKSRNLEQLKETMLASKFNYAAPKVVIEEATPGCLKMRQDDVSLGGLDVNYAVKTLEYIFELWKEPIEVLSINDEGKKVKYSFDKDGFKSKVYS
ncbi:SpoVR family protein [Candidatus Riflebacteria bacterium]